MKKRKYILLLFSLFCLVNTQASNHLKWVNKVLKEHQIKFGIRGLSPIFNGYAFLESCNKDDIESPIGIHSYIDIKNRVFEVGYEGYQVMDIIRGGYVIYDAGETDENGFKIYEGTNLGIKKLGGETVTDSVYEWLSAPNFFIVYKKIANTDTLVKMTIYKEGKPIHSDTCFYEIGIGPYGARIIYDRYCWLKGKLYDENFKKVIDEDVSAGVVEMPHHDFIETYPNNYSFFAFSKDSMNIYNKKCKKKYVAPLNIKKDDNGFHCYNVSFLWDKKLIVMCRRVYNLEGVAVSPKSHYFSGYFKDYLIYDKQEEAFASTIDGFSTPKIKLGKCSLEKSGKKWVLKSPLSTDSIDLIIGLNSDKHIGIKVGKYIGIIDRDGKSILPICYDKIYIDKLYYIGQKGYEYVLFNKKGKLLADGMTEIMTEDEDGFTDSSYGISNSIPYGDRFRYVIFKEGKNKYRYWLRNKKKSKAFYADDINTADLSNKYLPIKKDGIWQYLEIK